MNKPERPRRHIVLALLAGLTFAGGLALAIGRVALVSSSYSEKAGARWVMTDFFTSAYYPVRALLEGGNPHNRTWFLEHYRVSDMYGPFLPVNLLINLPFGLMPPGLAALLYFCVTVLLIVLLAVLSFRLAGIPVTASGTALTAGLILLSRPGHWTLMLGQSAILLSCFAYLALDSARGSPIASGLALALAALKPTFGVPLGLMMLARRSFRAVGAAVVISLVLNLPLLWLLASRSGGLHEFIATTLDGLKEWQAVHGTDPAFNHHQIDAASFIGRLLGQSPTVAAGAMLGVGLIGIAALALAKLNDDDPVGRDLSLGIVCTTVLLSIRHAGYDLVILAAPLIALVVHGLPAGIPQTVRWTLLGMYAIPAVNWITTDAGIAALRPDHAFWLVLASINGFCVAALFVGYVVLAFVHRQPSTLTSLTRHGARST